MTKVLKTLMLSTLGAAAVYKWGMFCYLVGERTAYKEVHSKLDDVLSVVKENHPELFLGDEAE